VETELDSQLDQQKRQQISSISSIKFQTSFEELYNKHELLTTGIEKIDSSLQLTPGDRLAVVGNRKYAQILVIRLCVNALLSSPSKKNQQGRSRYFYTPNLILVDAGNNTDFYQYVNFARQYCGSDVINRVLNNTILTRCFTVYQLTDVIINQLPKVIQQYDAKMVVISDLLDMFIRDPQIETNGATYLINEIVNSITKSKALEDVLVVVSLPYVRRSNTHNNNNNNNNNKPSMSCGRMILPRFDKCIEIINGKEDKKNNNMIDIKISNNSKSKKIKNTSNGFHDEKFRSINKRDLLIVSAPTE
jgi:hypothetical protein